MTRLQAEGIGEPDCFRHGLLRRLPFGWWWLFKTRDGHAICYHAIDDVYDLILSSLGEGDIVQIFADLRRYNIDEGGRKVAGCVGRVWFLYDARNLTTRAESNATALGQLIRRQPLQADGEWGVGIAVGLLQLQ